MVLDRAQMFGDRIVGGFAGLGHQICDVNARRAGTRNGAGNFRNQKIRQDAGVERARAHQNQIGFANGVDGFREAGEHCAARASVCEWASGWR